MGFVGNPKSAKFSTWRDAEMSQMLQKLTFLGGSQHCKERSFGDLKSENCDSWRTPLDFFKGDTNAVKLDLVGDPVLENEVFQGTPGVQERVFWGSPQSQSNLPL